MERISVGTENFKVRSYQMDMEGRLTLTGIAGYLQESAGNHAHKVGFGYIQMLESGLLWVLTRLKIVVHQYPHWSDDLSLETWVVNREKFFSRRDFEIKSINDEVLISAVSGWMLLDMKAKRPQLVDAFPMDIDFFPDRLALTDDIAKIQEMDKPEAVQHYRVNYSDIDIVNHVNNTQYIRIILDSQPYELRSNFHIKSFEINYIAEALMNDELNILTQSLTNNQYLHEIKRLSDQKIICRAMINWEKD